MKRRMRRWMATALSAALLLGGVGAAPALTGAADTAEGTGVLKIACVGASTTAGTNGYSYPAYLQMMLGGGAEVKNFGYPGCSVIKGRQWSYIDGWHTENFQRMYQDSLDYRADVVIIDMGVNDAGLWNGGNNTFAADYEELLLSYVNQEQRPLVLCGTGGYLVHLTPEDAEKDRVLEEYIQPVEEEIAARCQAATADLRAVLMSDETAYMDEDGVHYTAAGYQAVAEMYYRALTQLTEIPGQGDKDPDEMIDPVDCNVPIGEYDEYRCLMWENGQTGGFAYNSGALAFALGLESGTVAETLTIDVSYYWDYHTGGNDWWHFNTTDQEGLSAPGQTNGNPHDNGFGKFSDYEMKTNQWAELTVSREKQLLGGDDWRVNVGDLSPQNSLYIRGYRVTAALADGTAVQAVWGSYVHADAPDMPDEPDTPDTPDEPETPGTPDEPDENVLSGDVNRDGGIDTTDARLTLQYAARRITAEKLDMAAADVNGDGTVDTTDARLILQYAARRIDGFCMEK